MSKHTHSFQAEVSQLLHLVTHSLYSNKEIFLRELVSNASDACDKLRYEALNNNALFEDAPNLEIRVSFDKAARTLTIADNGIGMSRQEAIDHLGTIAKSGTRDFMSRLSTEQKSDAKEHGSLIGQFGVGFYSGYIVADKITVLRRGAVAGESTPKKATPAKLAEMMVGREVQLTVSRSKSKVAEPVLQVKGLNVLNDSGVLSVNNATFEVRSGEILAVAGVQGNGQTELVEALTGLRLVDSGSVSLEGRPLPVGSPREIASAGVAHIPEDRHHGGDAQAGGALGLVDAGTVDGALG